MPRPSREEMLIAIAHEVAKRGTCLRLQVGAVIAREGRPLSIGYNGAPSGLPHCTTITCTENEPCTWATHAEANAITFAAREGIRTNHTEMYLTDSPCLVCARLIINAGIDRVFYDRKYRDTSGIELLTRAGVYCAHYIEETEE